ncbi:MAG: MBL fold metallo-hydrolase [Hyalangium sp.]|uniref:MBL fold metallo-hydrolase n=1 Tax=Hyalangium sp. TaxID=2028555 RepID=UPI00389A2FF1
MYTPHLVADGTYYFAGAYDQAGIGMLPVNFYAIKGSKKTILIDTGAPPQAEDALKALKSVIDPKTIDYIFITHMDIDHYGGLKLMLEEAPQAQLVGNLTNMLKGVMWDSLAPPRFAVVWPGQEIDLGDRKLRAEQAFLEDTWTFWLSDEKTKTLFASDTFGAMQFGPPANFSEEQPAGSFASGFTMWHQANFTTIPMLDKNLYREAFSGLQKRGFKNLASVHGPFIRKDVDQVFELIQGVPTAPPLGEPPLPPLFNLR